MSSAVSRVIRFTYRQLQKKFEKHAKDFGGTRNWGRGAAEEFQAALEAHVQHPATEVIFGTYRNTQDVAHFFNPDTGLNVMGDANGEYSMGDLAEDVVPYLILIRGLLAGTEPSDGFPRRYMQLWRASRDSGRLSELNTASDGAFDRLFTAADAYCEDPSLRDPGDLDKEQMVEIVRSLAPRIERLSTK